MNLPAMITFDDTRPAFSAMDDKALRRAALLFRILRYPFLVKTGKALVTLAQGLGIPVAWAVKPLVFRHFCGGEDIGSCKAAVDTLAAYNIKTILDYSAESRGGKSDQDFVKEEIIRVAEAASNDTNIPFAVFKPSGIFAEGILEKMSAGKEMDTLETRLAEEGSERFRAICTHAAALKVPVMIDAEESWVQPAIDRLTEEMMQRCNRDHPLVFHTLQMYRTDRAEYLEHLLADAARQGYIAAIKFVRGAYMEKERARAAKSGYPSPIHNTKEDTDRAYDNALKRCATDIGSVSVCAATHNEASSSLLASLAEETPTGRAHPHFWFAQLYGMSNHISFTLAQQGFNVCKYVPYGPVERVLPYLIRRAEENTSVAGQTGRELRLISTELARRKNQQQ